MIARRLVAAMIVVIAASAVAGAQVRDIGNDVPAGYDIRGIRLEDIAALEFYNGPSSIPLELGDKALSDANCGLFVIWLKERRRPR